MKAITIILKPVGLIGSPAAITAYLAHEAKKKPVTVPSGPRIEVKFKMTEQ